MVCFVSPHNKIRRTPEDAHAQARNFAERSTNASRISLGTVCCFVFRVQLRFVVPRGTPNDSCVKYIFLVSRFCIRQRFHHLVGSATHSELGALGAF